MGYVRQPCQFCSFHCGNEWCVTNDKKERLSIDEICKRIDEINNRKVPVEEINKIIDTINKDLRESEIEKILHEKWEEEMTIEKK